MSDIHGSCLCGDIEISVPKDLQVVLCRKYTDPLGRQDMLLMYRLYLMPKDKRWCVSTFVLRIILQSQL
jgi:hypothetical protein